VCEQWAYYYIITYCSSDREQRGIRAEDRRRIRIVSRGFPSPIIINTMFVQLGRGEGTEKNRTHILWLINNNNDDGLTRSRPVIVCQTVSLIHYYYYNIIRIFIFIISSFQFTPHETLAHRQGYTLYHTIHIIVFNTRAHFHIIIIIIVCTICHIIYNPVVLYYCKLGRVSV